MVERAGNTGKPPLVRFVYTDENGDKQSKRLYLQQGLIFDFYGGEVNENGQYTIGEDGKVYNEKGDVVSEINLSKDQIGALMGIATFNQTDNPAPRFEISDEDISRAMYNDNGHFHDAVIRDYLGQIGADKDIVPYGQGFKPEDEGYDPDFEPQAVTFGDARGFVETELTGSDGSKSGIKISSPRLKAEHDRMVAEYEQEVEAYKKEHPIKYFFFGYDRNNP